MGNTRTDSKNAFTEMLEGMFPKTLKDASKIKTAIKAVSGHFTKKICHDGKIDKKDKKELGELKKLLLKLKKEIKETTDKKITSDNKKSAARAIRFLLNFIQQIIKGNIISITWKFYKKKRRWRIKIVRKGKVEIDIGKSTEMEFHTDALIYITDKKKYVRIYISKKTPKAIYFDFPWFGGPNDFYLKTLHIYKKKTKITGTVYSKKGKKLQLLIEEKKRK
ncbi:MAG: hypothetical protein COA57_14575 [Flavobacteriales bacterium]|nr:hypothetical protein [Bacteroidia bacterium]PCJ81135.1 MAG: hypothetical protein COA57_14575 [Flavobacteriales bacterium]